MLYLINARIKKKYMPQTIRILEDCLINKIAAGEVIENPASAVKELVENAIDAKAQNIHVEIKGSGLQLIKVEDDGIGMSRADSILCFKRHATSKIQKFEDLIKICSMGFRGEALASIAAVSKVELKTSQDNIATHVKVEASKIISVSEIARTKGTTIEVKSLFFNVPVRKKFQKTLSYINSEIVKTLISLVLSHPNIGFSFVLNGKKIFAFSSDKKEKKIAFKQRIKKLLSKDFTSSCVDIDFEINNIKIFGYIGEPQSSKKTRSSQYLIMNDRVVNSNIISRFVKEAYSTRIAEDDFPVFALHIIIPLAFIDVNVHPQKKEIKIREHLFIKESIKKAVDLAFLGKAQKKEKEMIFFKKDINFTKTQISKYEEVSKENIFEKFEKQLFFDKFYHIENILEDFLQIDHFIFVKAGFLKNYLDLKDEDEIVIIDLSAIFAYFLFEKITNKELISASQNLLIPINIELGREDICFLEDNLQVFANLGFEVRIIGKNSIFVDAVPDVITKENVRDLFFLILEDLKHYDAVNMVDKIYEKKNAKEISILAKKKSFSKKETVNLLNMFVKNKKIKFDFLGNPFFVTFDKEKIEKLLKK